MKVWVVPYAYEVGEYGLPGLMGVEVFDDKEKAKQFVDFLKKDHADKKCLDFFIQEKEVK